MHKLDGSYEPPVYRSLQCGTFPLAEQVAKCGSRPTSSADQALEENNHELFPNVHKLLRILCRLPITSEECERSFSTLRRLKTHLRATMTSERESGLSLMNIHYESEE